MTTAERAARRRWEVRVQRQLAPLLREIAETYDRECDYQEPMGVHDIAQAARALPRWMREAKRERRGSDER